MQDAISHDPYEDQLSAARFKAERDVAIQERDRMRPAFEWVEEHGGLDAVREEWKRRSNLERSLDNEKEKVARQQRHIEDVQEKLGRRGKTIADLNDEIAKVRMIEADYRDALNGICGRLGLTDGAGLPEMLEIICAELDRRLMPEGYMWPEFENGDPVRIGDEFADGGGNTRRCTSIEILHGEEGVFDALIHWSSFDPFAYLLVNMWLGGRVKRPAPKALDADGVEIRVGDTVWDEHGDELVVLAVYGQDVHCRYAEYEDQICDNGTWEPSQLTHQRPVLDADGVEIREGDTVYEVKTGDKFVVETIYPVMTEPDFPEHTVRCHKPGDITAHMFALDMLTHRAPVLAADGKPLREGETVWHVETGGELVVKKLPKPGEYQAVIVFALPKSPTSHLTSFDPDQLTHERPETDSWQRLGEDVSAIVDAEGNGEGSFTAANAYCERNGLKDGTVWVLIAQDLVRRAKKLAERGQ